MTLIVETENYTGVDCSGSNGASNRVLTLTNTTETTNAGFLVYASGLALSSSTEYSVVHNITGTQITFLNGMWNDMTIVVKYYRKRVTSNVYEIMRDDIQGIIIDHGSDITLIRQTETKDSVGGVTAVSEEEYTIWTLIQDITRKDRQIHEMGLAIPGNSKAFFFHEYPDDITGNGIISVEVGNIIKDTNNNKWRVEEIISQKQADNNEIFRTGIIKNIELSE